MSSSGGGQILEHEEENDNEVRREDQQSINKFGRLNALLYEVRGERDAPSEEARADRRRFD